MAQEIINNGETGGEVRGKLNANFTDLYENKAASTAPAAAVDAHVADSDPHPQYAFENPAGVATITLPGGIGVFEHQETVAAAGVMPTNRIFLNLAPTNEDDENAPEMCDIENFSATAGTDQITISATFRNLSSGPFKFNWGAI